MIKEIPAVKETAAFVVREVVAGSLVAPTASNWVAIAGSPTAEQMPETMESPEIFSSLSIIERCKTQNKAGTWTLPIVLHCAGAAGTEPNESLLMEAALGTKTVSAGVDVAYTPAKVKPSFSQWYSLGHTVYFMSGCSVDQVSFDSVSPATNCYVNATFSGKFMKRGWVTSGTLSAAITGSTVNVGVANIGGYTVGGLVYFEDDTGGNVDNNSGSGYQITSVNYTAGTFTVNTAPSYAGGAGDHVKAFIPSVTPTTVPLPAKYLGVSLAGAYTNVVSFGLTVGAEQFYLDDESTDSGYPEQFLGVNSRMVDITMTAYFRPEWVKYLKTINDNDTVALSFLSDTARAAAGERLSIPIYRFRVNQMTTQESNGVYQVTMTGTGDGTSGEDELEIAYS